MKQPIIFRVFKGDQLIEVKQYDQEQVIIGNGGEASLQLSDISVSPIHALIELTYSG